MASFLIVHLAMNMFGGSERVCHYIIKSLVEHNQEVELLSFEFDKGKYKEIIGEAMPQVVIHELPCKFKIKPPLTLYKRYYLISRSLIKFLRNKLRKNYDFLFLTQASNPIELIFLKFCKKTIGYVHFPEIHHEYEKSSIWRKLYLLPLKRLVEKNISGLDLIICNSYFTKRAVIRYWGEFYSRSVKVVYPPVDLNSFWCKKPLHERKNRVVYVGRFIPAKRHDIIKNLAKSFPDFEFVSVGLLTEEMESWFKEFRKDSPLNYFSKPNLPRNDLRRILQESKIYVHLMDGEHFGIAPIEALASGCITLIPENSGAREFIPEIFRWKDEEDLKNKLSMMMRVDESWWSFHREILWQKIRELHPETFSLRIWGCLKEAYPQYFIIKRS